MLNIQNYTKRFGDKIAVDDLSLHIAAGEICAFIGHNGAGKTTTLKACCGLLKPDGGTITVNGIDIQKDPIACKKIMAYIPDNPDLYEFLTGYEYLNFVADMYGVSEADRKARMEALGLINYEDLQGYFTKRVVAILKKHGKRAVCWNDVLESKDVDTENIIQYWTAQHEAPVPAFIERGGKVIFSNMSALYFDYPHGINSLNKVYHYQPVVMGKSYADSPNMLGYEAALWSEQVETPEHLEELLFPRLYAVSEIAWNEAGDYADFEHRAEKKIEIAAKQGVNCMTKDGWNPEGEARVQSAATFIAHMMNPGGIGTPHTDAEREMVRPVIEKFAQIWFRPQDVPEMMKNDDLVGAAFNFMKMFPPENDETKGE